MDTSTEAVKALRHIEAVLDCEEAGTLNLDDLPKAAREAMRASRQEILDTSAALLAERDAAVAEVEKLRNRLAACDDELARECEILTAGVNRLHARLAKAEGDRDAAVARAEAAEAALEQAREWNRRMVEKAASGGVLDGYRELGAKVAAAEAEAQRLREALAEWVAAEAAYPPGNLDGLARLSRARNAARAALRAADAPTRTYHNDLTCGDGEPVTGGVKPITGGEG